MIREPDNEIYNKKYQETKYDRCNISTVALKFIVSLATWPMKEQLKLSDTLSKWN